MDLRYPRNAGQLVALRRNREIPALPVLVTLAGPLAWSNLTLSAVAGQRYDWRPVMALDVEVFASADVPFADLLATLADIAAVVPKTMVLTFLEGPRIHCGESRTLMDFALFDWLPMSIGPSHYAEARKIEKRIWAELGRSIPIPFDEAVNVVGQVIHERAQEQAEWRA